MPGVKSRNFRPVSRMAITAILLCLLATITQSYGDDVIAATKSIPPLYSCSGKTLSPGSILAMCPVICDYSWDLTRSHIIDIFNQVRREKVEILECSAYKEVRVESESYLFSKTSEIVSSERFLPKLDRCRDLINQNCMVSPCNYIEALPAPDYSWGKDKTATYIRYTIHEHLEAVTVFEGVDEYFVFGKDKIDVKSNVYLDKPQLRYLIWNSHKGAIKSCPFDRSKTALAYSDLSHPLKLWVPDLGMILHLKSPQINDPRCVRPGTLAMRPLILTEEGLIIANSSYLETVSSARTVIVSSSMKDNEKLILKNVNSMEMMREREFCLANCYLVEDKGLHILGAGGVYTKDISSSIICTHFVAPVVASPTQVCIEPKIMLKVSYDQTMAWWDPELPILNTSESCSSLLKKLPRKQIDRGAVVVNSSGIFLKRFKLLRDMQSRAFSQTHLDDYIVAPSESKLDYNYNPGSATVTSAKKTSSFEEEYDNWFSSLSGEIGGLWGRFTEFLSGIGDEVRVVSIFVASVIIIWVMSLLYRVIRAGKNEHRAYRGESSMEQGGIETRERLVPDYRSARAL
ncbi:TPA_asm: G [Begonia betacytorhabdovirus 1]|nr:TPA_asm: G [Begonia betacytorhabdovirus 1]